jgi:hypothetical protein
MRGPSRSSSFAAGVLKLVAGTTVAQAIAVLAFPLLTRLYGPEVFGLSLPHSSASIVVKILAVFGYHNDLPSLLDPYCI